MIFPSKLTACVKGGYDFSDVRDVAAGILSAAEHGRTGECYILSNRYVEIKELLDVISEVRGTKKIKVVLPMWLAKVTAPLSEAYYAILARKSHRAPFGSLLRHPEAAAPLYEVFALYHLSSRRIHQRKGKEGAGLFQPLYPRDGR